MRDGDRYDLLILFGAILWWCGGILFAEWADHGWHGHYELQQAVEAKRAAETQQAVEAKRGVSRGVTESESTKYRYLRD